MNGRYETISRRVLRVLAAAAILVAGIVIGATLPFPESQKEATPQPARRAAGEEKSSPATQPVSLLPLDRPQLLLAFAAAADASANGKPPPASNASLVGRSFILRLPFGCDGPSADLASAWAGWTYDPKTRALKLQAQPEVWGEAPWIKSIAGETPFEAVEGFWIRRPWTNAETCPSTRSETPTTRTGDFSERQTIGVAQFFAPGGPRTLRRGSRPYAVTLRVDEEMEAKPHTYHLLISGRIVGFDDGQPIHCRNEADNLRPVCLISVEFNRVAFVDADDGSNLSEWHN